MAKKIREKLNLLKGVAALGDEETLSDSQSQTMQMKKMRARLDGMTTVTWIWTGIQELDPMLYQRHRRSVVAELVPIDPARATPRRVVSGFRKIRHLPILMETRLMILYPYNG